MTDLSHVTKTSKPDFANESKIEKVQSVKTNAAQVKIWMS